MLSVRHTPCALVCFAVLMLCLSAAAQGQTDTSRRPPVRPATPRASSRDSLLPGDIENIEIIKTSWLADAMGPVARRRMTDTLDAHRRIWNGRRPRAYVIRTVSISDCMDVRTRPRENGELLRARLVVRDTTVVGQELAPIPASYEQRCPILWRVDDLFAEVAKALADTSTAITQIEFDAAYGFPRFYWLYRGTARGRGVLVESFAPSR